MLGEKEAVQRELVNSEEERLEVSREFLELQGDFNALKVYS